MEGEPFHALDFGHCGYPRMKRRGVEQTMARLSGEEIDLAILQPRSPSCGCREIYDGSFSGKKIPGKGLFAQALADAGIPLKSAEEIENI